MSLMSWDPFTTMSRLDRDFDDLVRRTWGGPRAKTPAGFVPAVEMLTDGADVLVRLEIPGIDAEKDLDVEVEDGRLTVSGRREETVEEASEDRKLLVREHRYGSFRRDFALPSGVTGDDIDATYDQGILEVRIAGLAQPEPAAQKVSVKSGKKASKKVIEGSVSD